MSLSLLDLKVLTLDPGMMDGGGFMVDMLLEDNDVGIGYLCCLCR